MDLVQLEYFKAVAEAGHLTNAAKKLNVAQPALSVSIARLEREVGVPLFDRVGRGIYLNRCGEIYLEHVEQAIRILKDAQEAVDAYCQKAETVLNLGVVNKPFSQTMLMRFKSQFPDSRVRQITIEPSEVEEELAKEEIDYAITSRPSKAPGLIGEVVKEEKMLLAVPAGHPLASRPWIRLSDAKGEDFINLPKEYEYRMVTDEMCAGSGFTAHVVAECFHCHMAEMVAAGKGVAFLTATRAAQNAGNSRLVTIPIRDPELTMRYYVIWKAGHHFNTMAKEFRKCLRDYFKEQEGGCEGCQKCD